MLLKLRKKQELRREGSRLFLILSLGFSTLAFPQAPKGLLLKDMMNKDFTVTDLLESTLDPAQAENYGFEPDEYVTQEPTLDLSKRGVFEPLSNLSSVNENRTFEALVQKAKDNYLALQSTSSNPETAAIEALQPASPLSELLGSGPVVPHDSHSDSRDDSQHLINVGQKPAKTEHVSVTLDKKTIKVSAKEIFLPSIGAKLPFVIEQKDNETSELGFFVDSGVVDWNPSDRVLSAKKEGTGQIFLHYENQLLMLPVHVGKLQVEASVSTQFKVLQNLASSKTMRTGIDTHLDHELNLKNAKEASHKEISKKTHKVAKESLPSSKTESFSFALNRIPLETQKVEFRVVDERTDSQKNYPIVGAELKIIGTEFRKQTDSLGLVSGVDIPRNSSFLVSVKDPYQRYRPTVVEISASKLNTEETIPVTLLQQGVYEAYLQIAGSEGHGNLGSVCARVQSKEGKLLEGVTVSLDSIKTRPYYFNRYGFLDPQLSHTSEYAKFCVFDLEPGPFAFYFEQENGQKEGAIPLTVFAGSHLEHTFTLGKQLEINTVLAAAPTAFELWHGGRIMEKELRAIDYASFISLNSTQDWDFDPDSLKMRTEQGVSEGKAYYLSRSSEFEETLYRADASKDKGVEFVTPLFPNGFVEDLSYNANILRDVNNGTVLVEHGNLIGQMELSKDIEVTLWDQNSKAVGEKVLLNSEKGASAVFFNVSPGSYTIVVKSKDGVGIAYDTVLVYSGTLSYVHTGSPLLRESPNTELAQDLL